MGNQRQPYIAADGTHIFPLINIHGARTSETFEQGEIRWNLRDGVSFSLESKKPYVPVHSEPAARPTIGGTGTVGAISFAPDWIGQLADGSRASLIGTNRVPKTESTFSTDATSFRRTLAGTAAYASLALAKESDLAFWFDTDPVDRLYFQGLELFAWEEHTQVKYSVGQTQKSHGRGSLSLSLRPRIQLFSAANYEQRGAWLTYDATPAANPLWYDPICIDARDFLSFMIGQPIDFLWKDSFTPEGCISRVYLWRKRRERINGIDQPVPLIWSSEALTHGAAVVSQLAKCFRQFLESKATYSIGWIASPLWLASDCFLEDRLALACVSLERLAAAHNDSPATTKSVVLRALPKRSQRRLLEELRSALKAAGSELQIPGDKLEILDSKLSSIFQSTNSEKLTNVFEDVGIALNDREKEAIRLRNHCLHGRATLGDFGDTQAVNDEVRRFDTLRTLINRAILSLLGYEGPYIDYSERPSGRNFPIKWIPPYTESTQ